MKKLYLDMKHTSFVPQAYRMNAGELSAAAGVNLGNFVFRHALNFLINDLHKFTPVLGGEFNEIVKNGPVEHVLVSCANWLGQTAMDEQFNLGRAKMIESVDCPVTAFGLGVQASSMTSTESIRLGPNSIRLASALAERGPQLSVRDEITRRTLEAAGIKNAVVTGCPSNFINCDPDLGAQAQTYARNVMGSLASWKDVRSAISEVTGGHALSGKVMSTQMRMLDETPAFYLLQTPGLLPFLLGKRTDIPDIYRTNNPFMNTPGQLTRALKAKTLHFSSVDSWLDFSRTCDISFGMRIHGTVVPLQAGVASVLIAHDSRTVGLAQAMCIPWVTPEAFLEIAESGPRGLFDVFIEQIEGYDSNRQKLAGIMNDYLQGHGLKPAKDLGRLLAGK